MYISMKEQTPVRIVSPSDLIDYYVMHIQLGLGSSIWKILRLADTLFLQPETHPHNKI